MKSKESKVETALMRVSKKSQLMTIEIQKIVAVESNGEVLTKTGSLEIALEEFLQSRKRCNDDKQARK